jgi:hypothetical protein
MERARREMSEQFLRTGIGIGVLGVDGDDDRYKGNWRVRVDTRGGENPAVFSFSFLFIVTCYYLDIESL